MLTDLDNNSVELSDSSTEVTVPNGACVEQGKEVVVTAKNYTIVGDNIYLRNNGDLPAWVDDYLLDKINVSINDAFTDIRLELLSQNGNIDNISSELNQLIGSVVTALDSLEIAENQYAEYMNIDERIDSIISTHLTTLNASLANNSASIVNLQQTSVTESEALSIAAQHLTSELADGAIKSSLTSLQSTLANDISANALSIDALLSTITDPETGLTATASAVESLVTDVYNLDGVATSLAGRINEYDSFLVDPSTGSVGGANSLFANTVQTVVDEGVLSTESKFAYDSVLNIDGKYYYSGFGIVSTGTQSEDPLNPSFDSEFWVKADKFKVVGTDNTGTEVENSVFSVDTNTGTVTIGADFTEATRNVFVGDWSANKGYKKGDVVFYNGSSYSAKNDFTSGSSFSSANWDLYGASGASINIIFKRSTNSNEPAPSPSVGVPTGWYDDAIDATGTGRLFASKGTKEAGQSNYVWGTPYVIEADAVAEITIYRLNSSTLSNNGSYSFTTNVLTPPTSWSTSAPSLVNDGDVVYARTTLVTGSKTSSVVPSWSSASVYSRRVDGTDGVNGSPGPTGPRGAFSANIDIVSTSTNHTSSSSVSYHRFTGITSWTTSTSSTNTYSEIETYYTLLITGSTTEKVGDSFTVNLYSSSGSSAPWKTITWHRTSSGWVYNVALKVNGDAVVEGTLHASRLTAGHIGTVDVKPYSKNFSANTSYSVPLAKDASTSWEYYGNNSSTFRQIASDGSVNNLIPVSRFLYIESIIYENISDVTVNVLVSFQGRTGYTSNIDVNEGSKYFVLTDNYGHSLRSGWTPSFQDFYIVQGVASVDPGEKRTFRLYMAKASDQNPSNYTLSLSGNLTIIGVVS